jgi:hypothetical protein
MRRFTTQTAFLLLASVAVLPAFMREVPFSESPDIPKLTRQLCLDTLGTRLFAHPGEGTSWCWGEEADSSVQFVVDDDWNRICYWVSGSDAIHAFGSCGGGNGQFRDPGGIDMDGQGRVFVADRKNKRVVQLSYDFGNDTLTFVRNVSGLDTFQFGCPNDVAWDDNGTPSNPNDDELWIADPGRGSIFKMGIGDQTLHGKYTWWEEEPGAWFSCPVSIAAGQSSGVNNHTAYIADRGHQRVVMLEDSSGHLLWRASVKLSGRDLASVSTDYLGYVYVSDTKNSQIVRLDHNLANPVVYGSFGTGYGQLNRPVCFSIPRNTLQGFVIEKWDANSGIRNYVVSGGISRLELPDSAFDATTESLRIELTLESPASVTVRVLGGCVLSEGLQLDTGDYAFYWSGRDQTGRLVLPDSYKVTVEAWGNGQLGWHDIRTHWCRVEGTAVQEVISGTTTWDSLHDPYVLTNDLSIDGGYGSAKLTIQPGVRVMFHDEGASQSISVGSADRVEAVGTADKRVYFMPHRKMADGFDPGKRGWWGGLHFDYHSNGAKFSNCIFENGGGSGDQAVVYLETPVSPVDFDSCRFDGSLEHAIVAEVYARDSMNINCCEFYYCGNYPIDRIKAPAVSDVSATCTFKYNDYNGILVQGGSGDDAKILNSCTWHCHEPGFYFAIMDGDLVVEDTLGIGTTFTIEPGATVRVGSGNGVRARKSGAIVARGGQGAPIIFEGISGDTWDGIKLEDDALNSSSFKFCVFRNGVGNPKYHDGINYFPMLWCAQSCTLSSCAFLDARRDSPTESGTGIYIDLAAPHIRRCVFHKNETGILSKFTGQECYAESCQIDSGEVGYRVATVTSASRYGILHSNIFGNAYSGVYNFDASESLYARHNWWGPDSGGQAGKGSNNQASGFVWADSAESTRFQIWSKDAQVVSIVRPPFLMEPGKVQPMGIAQNNYYSEVTLTAMMRIGAEYADTVPKTLAAFAADSVVFDSVELDTGTYQVVFKVTLAGDSMPANDSMVSIVRVTAAGAGWTALTSLPALPSGRAIKDGGCMTYDVGTARIYASKGNRSGDFYAYSVSQGTWTNLDSVPKGQEGKRVSWGSVICSDGNGKLYLTKGNNTVGFYEYDAEAKTWTQKCNVPWGYYRKRVKKGAGLAWATKNGVGYVYLLKGYRNELYKYSPVANSWDSTLPLAPGSHLKWGAGSWLVADPRPGANVLYAFQAKYHKFYVYDTDADTWSLEKTPMPIPGTNGNKKAKDGSCAAWFGDNIYALKGGNTTEFWRYFPLGDSWQKRVDIPLYSTSGSRKKVKAGAALAGCPDTGLYAFKGNKSNEFWWYKPGQTGGGEAAQPYVAGGGVAAAGGPTLGGEEPVMDGLEASKPRWNWQGTRVCYSMTDTLTEREQIYQCLYPMSSVEQRVVDMDEDCEEPVYSPDGQYIAFQLDDTVSGYYQLCVTPATDSVPGNGGLYGKDGDVASATVAQDKDLALVPASGFPISKAPDHGSKTADGQVPSTGTAPGREDPAAIRYSPLPASAPASGRAVCAGPGIGGVAASLGPVWQITYAEEDHCYPEWSPDGEWLCYERDDEDGYTQIWRVPAFGGMEQQLTFGNCDHFLPDYLNSNEIVFILSPDFGYDQIAKVHDSTLQVTVLSLFDTDHDKPSPSWNGANVAAEALDDSGNTQIVKVANLAGSEIWLTSGDADITDPDYGQDNQTIFAVRWTGITSQIVWVDALNGGYTAVTDSLAIRDNPDAHVDSVVSTSMAVYEREEWIPGGLLLGGGRRKHGSGVYLSKFRKKPHTHEGPQGASLGVFALDKAKPNPATNRVTIRWQVPVEADVSLRVYNTAGQLVKVLADGKCKPGAYTSVWNGTDAKGRRLANGVYFYALDNGTKRINRKVVLTE